MEDQDRKFLQWRLFSEHNERCVLRIMTESMYRQQAEATERLAFMREIGLVD